MKKNSHHVLCAVSTECKNPLALIYQQSSMHQKVLEELGLQSLMEMEGVKGQKMAANYVTSFFYQVTLKKALKPDWIHGEINCLKHI